MRSTDQDQDHVPCNLVITAQISGDVADGGASIGWSAGDPRVDRVDADHRSSDRARALLN